MKAVALKSPAIVLAAMLASLHAGAAPQTSEAEDLELVYGQQTDISIATGSSLPLRRAPAVATVLTAEDIAASGANDLAQILETVPGLHVARSTQVSTPMYVIRGISLGFNPQVLVLVNGVPQTVAFEGNRGGGVQGISLDNVSRIEVIRGPGSALYGAEAFAGVINVITKQAEEMPGTQAGLRAGTYQSRDGWLTHGGNWGPLSVAGYLRMGHSDGANPVVEADAQTGWDQQSGTHASRAPGRADNRRDFLDGMLDLGYEHWRAGLTIRQREHAGTGTGVASALDPEGENHTRQLIASLGYEQPQLAPNLALSVQGSWMDFEEFSDLTLFPAGTKLGGNVFQDGMIGNPYKWEQTVRVGAALTYSGWTGHKALAGLGASRTSEYRIKETKNFTPNLTPIGTGSVNDVIDVSDSVPFLRPQDRDTHYLVLQDEWAFIEDWALTAGWRQDHYSDFGTTNNPRLALVWDAAYDLTAKLMYGTAFRAPSFTELHAINNPVVKGNPALKPEKIKTVEAALSWQASKRLQLGMNVFRYDMRDIIRQVNFLYENAGRQTGTGLEFEAQWDIAAAWKLAGNYSYQFSRDEATGHDAGNAPHHHLFARLDWRLAPGWRAHAQWNQISEQTRVASDTRAPLHGYGTLDLNLRKLNDAGGGWGFGVLVSNVFNADVREPSPFDQWFGQPFISLPKDFPQAGRTWTFQATYAF